MPETAPKRPRGRPLACETPEIMAECIDREIERCAAEDKPITLTGMMIACGIYSRATFDGYEKREGFSELIKKAKALVAHAYEERLSYDKPTGAIFALKNMGWRDEQTARIANAEGETFKTEGASDVEVARRIAYLLASATREEPET